MARGGKTIAWTAAAVALTAVGVTLAVSYDALVEWWLGIPVVRTWADLLAQPPIDLGDGVTVRLGIEGKRGPRWSGVLVYCLAEGCKAVPSPGDPAPVSLRFSLREGTAPGLPPVGEVLSLSSSREPGPPLLFAHAVPFPVIGKLQLRVLSPGGAQLRCSTIEGTAEAFHPWMPLEWRLGARSLLKRSPMTADLDDGGTFLGYATNCAGGIALPDPASDAPFPASGTAAGLGNPDLLLPSLLPRPGEPEIEMRVRGQLVLTPSCKLSPNLAELRILARWWVNGQPYIPEPAKVRAPFDGRGLEHEPSGKLWLGLEIESGRLGAKAGDTIGLQLLYTARGWVGVSPLLLQETVERPRWSANDDDPSPQLTNRIELTVP